MLAQPPLWFVLIAFLGLLGPLVVIHELGHYLVARAFGIGAESFSIGFGRELVGWTDRRGTRWKVGWLPLGGYVKFVGDADASSRPDPSAPARGDSFASRPVGQRFLVVLAGPMANFLLAILIFAAFFMALGAPQTTSDVGTVMPGSPAAAAGLRAGDRLVSIDGRSTARFEDVRVVVAMRPGQRVPVEVERDGAVRTVSIDLARETRTDEFGQRFEVGRLGVGPAELRFARADPFSAVGLAARETVAIVRAMGDGLGQIVGGARSVKELGGPVKMAQVAGQQASLGLFTFIHLIALFSINLGFINLLPVPMLDGGHLLLYSVEAVRRRPISERAQDWAFRGGFALLLALMMVTTVNDLSSIGLAERLHRLIG